MEVVGKYQNRICVLRLDLRAEFMLSGVCPQ